MDLKDSDLLELAYTCPQLSSLGINEPFGWRTPGITPTGLVRLLQQCPSLSRLCTALHTRGSTLHSQMQTSHRIPMRQSPFSMNVADSVIDLESIPAFTAFFADMFPLLGQDKQFSFRSWDSQWMCHRSPDSIFYMERWGAVCRLAKQISLERLTNRDTIQGH